MSSNNVGFNITKINDLLKEVAQSYNQIGEAICNDWSAFDNIIRTNWIGPDEVSNENELIDNIYYLYEKCREGIDDIITQIVNIGDYWIEFQKANVMSGTSVGTVNSATRPTISETDIKAVVKKVDQNWDDSTNLGLQDRSAATKIDTALDQYVSSVYNAAKNLYDSLDASEAFLGSQASSINTYLHEVGNGLAKLTSCHKTIKENLKKLAEAYITADTDVNTTMSGVDTSSKFNYSGENLK